MPYKATTAAKSASIPVGLAMGLAASWIITIVMAIGITFLIAGERVGETFLAPAAVVTVLVATFAGALVAAKKADAGRLIVCLASGAIYFLSLLCCNALFFDGAYQGLVPALLTVVGASLVAGLMGLHQKGQKFKARKRHYTA